MSGEFLEHQCKRFNESAGKLSGYDCPLCKNRGYLAKVSDGQMVVYPCTCMSRREILKRLKASGISKLVDFSGFETHTPWQVRMKELGMKFAEGNDGWFYIGGQPGCGKTHLCTAVLSRFLDRGMSGKYFLWREDSVRLKAVVNTPEYADLIRPFKQTDVLYIDDLFKGREGERPTSGDLNLAFELLNARYQSGKITVISSEKSSQQILDIDEAIGSRIVEKSKGFRMNIKKSQDKNWRLRE